MWAEWASVAAAWSGQLVDGYGWFVAACGDIANTVWFRLFFYLVLVATTIWVIAQIYSGALQNAEIGPVAIRKHKGSPGSIPLDRVVVHRDLVDLSNDGVQARCTFYYVYEGYRGKRQHIPLATKQMQLGVSATKLSDKVLTIVRGNEIPDVKSEEVYWPALDPESAEPQLGESTPASAQEYARKNRILERWTGDDNLQLISVHESLLADIMDARAEFITERVQKLRAAKTGSWFARLSRSKWARLRPGAVGNYYIKFQFSNDPLFVLRKHPDRDVRMTAWLTVLTSLFAMAMELFPLQPPPPAGIAGAAAAPIDGTIQGGAPPRPRPRVIP
jgi:hypothetical protein